MTAAAYILFCVILACDMLQKAISGTNRSKSTDNAPFRKTVKCLTNISSPSYLIYLPTHEGLVSNFNQLERLWSVLDYAQISKTIITTPITTRHFSSAIEDVRLCDIFVLPPGIKCSCAQERELAHVQKYCPVLGLNKTWSNSPETYYLTANQSALTLSIDFKNVSCVAGSMFNLKYDPYYAPSPGVYPVRKHFEVQFTPQYVNLADSVMQLLGFRSKDTNAYLAAHWRRGDQLTTRCKSTVSGYNDTSLNCGSVKEFIRTAHMEQARHNRKTRVKLPLYVATNERNATTLHKLHLAGFLTMANITEALRPTVMLDEDDIFVVEMVLMCKAQLFLYWGTSSVHTLVEKCRDAAAVQKRVHSEENMRGKVRDKGLGH